MSLSKNIQVLGVGAFSALVGVLGISCSDKGPTYIVYGVGGTGGDGSSGGSSNSGGSDPGSGGSNSAGGSDGSGGTDGSGGSGAAGGTDGSGGSGAAGGTDGSGGSGAAGGTDASGGSNASGGASGGSSGGGSGNTGGTGGTPQVDIALIDDFADCDGMVREVDGRKGAWYSLNAANTPTFGPPPSSSWTDQSCGAFLTGICPSCSVAGLAAIIAAGSYDLSPYSGISVKFESDATLYIAVKTSNGSTFGYLRSGAVPGTGTGGTRTVYFNSMTPDANFHGLSWAQEIHFTLDDYSKENGFGLGIHEVRLIP